MTPKARYFWPLLLVLLVTDCTTKDLVLDRLDAAPLPTPLIDSFVRLSLVHNPGTAFGFDLRPYVGDASRAILIGVMLAIVTALFVIYRRTPARATFLGAALGLTAGGGLGNLLDRFRYDQGVVDFIDVGIGTHRFWVFNVADAGITIGAVLLAILLLRQERAESASRPAV